jgi:hypothetical protein
LFFCGNASGKNINLYIEGSNMVNIVNGEWIVDLDAMTCRNINNKIVVSFEKKEDAVFVKMSYIPIDTLQKWSKTHERDDNMQKSLMEAEDVFLMAYFEKELEKNAIPEDVLNELKNA